MSLSRSAKIGRINDSIVPPYDLPKAILATQSKVSETLQSKKLDAFASEKICSESVEELLEETADLVPIDYLIRHKLYGYVKRRGLVKIQKFLQKICVEALRDYFHEWQKACQLDAAEKREFAIKTIMRALSNFLMRKRRYEIRRRKMLLQKEAELQVLKRKHYISCVTKVQSVWRMYKQIKIFLSKLPKYRAAAKKIQKQFRLYVRRKRGGTSLYGAVLIMRKRIYSARFIQRFYRGFVGRLRAHLIRTTAYHIAAQMKYEQRDTLLRHYFEQHGAALCLQRWAWKVGWPQGAVERKRKVIKQKFLESRIKSIQRVYRGHRGRKIAHQAWLEREAIQLQLKKIKCAIKIQALFRGVKSRMDWKAELEYRRNWRYQLDKFLRIKVL